MSSQLQPTGIAAAVYKYVRDHYVAFLGLAFSA